MNRLVLLILIFPFSVLAQISVKMESPLNYQIYSQSKWDSACARTGVLTSFETFTVYMGSLNVDHSPTFHFELQNDSTVPLVLTNVFWGEPCVQPIWSYEPIAPGTSSKLSYVCHTEDRAGYPLHKSSTIQSNFGTKAISFKGNVLPKYMRISNSTSIISKANNFETSFSVSHLSCENCPIMLKVDSVNCDKYTSVTFADSVIATDSSLVFHVNYQPDKEFPQFSRIRVYIQGTMVEHFVFIEEKKQALNNGKSK